MKRCTRCLRLLTLKSFTLYKRKGKEYLKSDCRSCRSKLSTEWKEKNLSRFNKYQKEYRKTHPSRYWEHLLNNPDKLEKRRGYQREAYRIKTLSKK